jgi:hypothetical protein
MFELGDRAFSHEKLYFNESDDFILIGYDQCVTILNNVDACMTLDSQ